MWPQHYCMSCTWTPFILLTLPSSRAERFRLVRFRCSLVVMELFGVTPADTIPHVMTPCRALMPPRLRQCRYELTAVVLVELPHNAAGTCCIPGRVGCGADDVHIGISTIGRRLPSDGSTPGGPSRTKHTATPAAGTHAKGA